MPVEDVFNIEVVARWRLAESSAASSRKWRKWKLSVSKILPRRPRPTSRCSVKLLDEARAGDNVGVLLRGRRKETSSVARSSRKPGSIKPHKKFKAEVYVLSKEEAAVTRRSSPIIGRSFTSHHDVTGAVKLPDGVEMVMPGDNIASKWNLGFRSRWKRRFASLFVKAEKTVGAGRVSDILD